MDSENFALLNLMTIAGRILQWEDVKTCYHPPISVPLERTIFNSGNSIFSKKKSPDEKISMVFFVYKQNGKLDCVFLFNFNVLRTFEIKFSLVRLFLTLQLKIKLALLYNFPLNFLQINNISIPKPAYEQYNWGYLQCSQDFEHRKIFCFSISRTLRLFCD